MKLTRKAYGKVNLFLSVGEKRNDGKHEVETVLYKVGIFDSITLEKTDEGGIKLLCNNPSIPTDERNIAVKAAILYAKKASIALNCRIEIEKRIPVTAGMGGGSSDAAAVLLMLNELFMKLSFEELTEIASSLGSDVPFFLYEDRAMIGKGSGDIMIPCECNMQKLYGIFVTYGEKESTGKSYALLDEIKKNASVSSSKDVTDALKHDALNKLSKSILNDFELCSPHFEKVKASLMETDCLRAFLCGSGPTVCGLFDCEKKAQAAIKKLAYPAFICEM